RAGAGGVGPGDRPDVRGGPLIRDEHRRKVVGYVERGVAEGARLLVDGRSELERPGFFLGPTVLDGVTPEMAVGREEIFGPVLSVEHVGSLEEAIAQANRVALGNMAVIFTSSGRSARAFPGRGEGRRAGIQGP